MMELWGGACGLWSSLPYFRDGQQVMRKSWAVDKAKELSSVEQIGAMSLTTAQRGHRPWGAELGLYRLQLLDLSLPQCTLHCGSLVTDG